MTAIHSVAGRCPRAAAADGAAVLRPAPHRVHRRDRRRRQRHHQARCGVAGPSRRAVPRRGPGVRPGRARRAASAAGVRRGRDREVGRDRQVPGPVHAGPRGQPVPVRAAQRRPARTARARRSCAGAVPRPAVRPAAGPGGREGRVPAGEPGRAAVRPRRSPSRARLWRSGCWPRANGPRRGCAAPAGGSTPRSPAASCAAGSAPAPGALAPLERAMDLGQVSARGADRIIRLSWTLADLAARPAAAGRGRLRARPVAGSGPVTAGWTRPGRRPLGQGDAERPGRSGRRGARGRAAVRSRPRSSP